MRQTIAHPIRRICTVMIAPRRYFFLIVSRMHVMQCLFYPPLCCYPAQCLLCFLGIASWKALAPLAPGVFLLQTAKGKKQSTDHLVFLAKIWTSGHALCALENNLRGIKAYFLSQDYQMLRDAPPNSGQV